MAIPSSQLGGTRRAAALRAAYAAPARNAQRDVVMKECRIETYRPEHKRSVAKLQTRLWSSDTALNTRYLEWKYERNPYVREPLIYLALAGDEVVGMRGFHGARLEAGSPSQSFPALFGDD